MRRKPKAFDDRLARSSASKEITVRQWRQIRAAFGECCAYCGKGDRLLCMEHMMPSSRGGDDSIENIVPSCRGCNSRKGDLTPLEWFLCEAGVLHKGPSRRTLRPKAPPPTPRPALFYYYYKHPIPIVVTGETALFYRYIKTTQWGSRLAHAPKERVVFVEDDAAQP